MSKPRVVSMSCLRCENLHHHTQCPRCGLTPAETAYIAAWLLPSSMGYIWQAFPQWTGAGAVISGEVLA